MLRDTFPELLRGHPVPEGEAVWELSRFAIETEGVKNYGFANLALDAIREIITFGDQMGIDHFLIVTTTAIERLLQNTGGKVTRLGPPMLIGIENTVALDIDLGEQTHRSLFGESMKAA
jgi:acyl homoserine lactone synthase